MWQETLVYAFSVGLGLFHCLSNMRIESYAPDSSYYIGLADAILEKGSYEFNFAPHIVYPPGLPLTLAFIALGFGSSYIVFVRAMSVIGVFGLLASYALLRRIEGRSFATATCLILGSSGIYFHTATQAVGSDVPYFLTSTLTLLFAMSLQSARLRLERWGFSLGLVVFLIFSLLLRTVAVALVAGIGAWLVSTFVFRRRDAALQAKLFTPALLIGGLVLAIWIMWVEQSKHKAIDFSGELATYVDQFWAKDPHRPELGAASVTDLLARPAKNIVIQGAHLSEIITRSLWIQALWYSPVVLAAVGLTVLGCGVSFRDGGGGIAEWYFTAYVFIYLFWPFDVGPRFVFPVFPLAFLYFWRGARQLKSYVARRPMLFLRYGLLLSVGLAVYTAVEVFLWRNQVSLQANIWGVFWGLAGISMAIVMAGIAKKLTQRLTLYSKALFEGKMQHLAGALTVLVLVIVGLAIQIETAVWNLTADPQTYVHQPYKEAADWIARHTRSDDVVMAQQISIVHRISGRQVANFPVRSDPRIIMDVVRRQGAKFIVVITSNRATNLQPPESQRIKLLRESFPESVVLVQRGNSYEIYRVSS